MKIRTVLLPEEWNGKNAPARDTTDAVVVFDVLRATTTFVTALTHGALGVYPLRSTKLVREYATTHPGWLLAGERGGLPPEGFDLGNSPLEFSQDVVREKWIVATTTNGTLSLDAAGKVCDRVFAGALRNRMAVAKHLIWVRPNHLLLVCAGTGNETALEDMIGVGALIEGIAETQPNLQLSMDDASMACRILFVSAQNRLCEVLSSTTNGARLSNLGLGRDIEFAAQLDEFDTVPCLKQGILVANRHSC